jgi:hypothetical protein
MHGRDEKLINIFVVRPEGKRLRGKPTRKWYDSTRMNVREIGWNGMDWMHLV